MTLADYSMTAFARLISSPAHQPAAPARRPLLLAKLREFAGPLLGALHESRRRRAAIILREHAPLTQLRSGGADLAIILYVAADMIWHGSHQVGCRFVPQGVCQQGALATFQTLL